MDQLRAHFHQMAEGQIPHCKYYYVISPQEGGGDVKLVTPTNVAVDQAKYQIKRKLSQIVSPRVKPIKKRKTVKSNQIGSGSRQVKINKKPIKQKNSSKNNKSKNKKDIKKTSKKKNKQ
jgi:hypothetical protein